MPNHVTHKILFPKHHLSEVQNLLNGDTLDFERLIYPPAQMYRGNLSGVDKEDFDCNWYDWQSLNWGTKWNAYAGSQGYEGNLAYIQFDTAWSVPYPIIAALANRISMEFEHRYFDEGNIFWGIEKWKGKDRISKRDSIDDDKKKLCIELKGYDPASQDEDD